MNNVPSDSAPLVANTFEISNNDQVENVQPHGPGILNRFAQSVLNKLGHKYTKVLAGFVLVAGLAAIPIMGPGAIPILVASGVLFGASTATSVLRRNPDQSCYEHIEDSLFYFGLPTITTLSSPALFTVGIVLFMVMSSPAGRMQVEAQ